MSGGPGEDTLDGRLAAAGEESRDVVVAAPGAVMEERIEGLRAELGDSVWRTLAPPMEIDGTSFSAWMQPEDGDSLAQTLRALSERGLAVVIRGGGSRMGLGNPPRGADLMLSTRGLAGIDEFEPAEGVLHAGAGTSLEAVREAAREEGWELAMDPPGAESTLGGVIASGAIGPRHPGFGPVRDSVLGLEVTLASGERTRCGGRVVKNVTGYDLAKLYTGSLGTLGVIEGAWLRLRPQPERVVLRVAEIRDSQQGLTSGIELGRRSSARIAALVSPGVARDLGLGDLLGRGSCGVMVCELAGHEVECEDDARWLEETLGAVPLAGDAAFRLVGDLRARLGARLGARALRARIALPPSRVERVCGPLGAAGAELIVHPSAGIVYAELSWSENGEVLPAVGEGAEARGSAAGAAEDPRTPASAAGETPATAEASDGARCAVAPGEVVPVRAVSAALERVGEAARTAGGALVIEEIPWWAKAGRDVLGGAPETLSLMRAVKARFDPAGTLNPGRFVGGL